MALNTNISSDNTTQFNELIKKELLINFRSQLVYAAHGMPAVHPKNNGEVARWLKVDDLTVDATPTALSEGQTPDGQSLVDSSVEATLAEYGGFVTISNKYRDIAVPDVMAFTSDRILRQASLTVDRISRNELLGTANNNFVDPATNASIANVQTNQTEISSSDVKKMVNILEAADVPKFDNGNYKAIMHPNMVHSLRNETGNSDWIVLSAHNTSADGVIQKGLIGSAFGADIIQTTEVPTDATSTDVYENTFLGKNVYGTTNLADNQVRIMTMPFGSAGTEDPLKQRATVGWHVMYVTKRLQENGIQSLHAYSA